MDKYVLNLCLNMYGYLGLFQFKSINFVSWGLQLWVLCLLFFLSLLYIYKINNINVKKKKKR